MGNEQVELWNHAVGEAWARHVDQYDATLAPFGEAVLAALGPGEGERILDVGCGVATTSLDLAARLPTSRVTGIDISVPMLQEARRRAAARGLTNVRLLEADAQTAELGASAYDVVFSRFGVMFFEDPAAAFAHLAAALVPGGRLGFVCFSAPGANPFILIPVMVAAAHLDLAAPSLDGPGPFSLGDRDRTAALLGDAGFEDVEIQPGPDHAVLHGAEDLEALAARVLEQNPVTAVRLAAVDAATRASAVQATAAALSEYAAGDEVRLGAGTWVVTARARRA